MYRIYSLDLHLLIFKKIWVLSICRLSLNSTFGCKFKNSRILFEHTLTKKSYSIQSGWRMGCFSSLYIYHNTLKLLSFSFYNELNRKLDIFLRWHVSFHQRSDNVRQQNPFSSNLTTHLVSHLGKKEHFALRR